MAEQWIKEIISFLAVGVEAVAALLIGIGAIETVKNTFTHYSMKNAHKESRLRLGRWLALALEFLLAADVLRTAVSPTWNEIGQLAAIATIRTALNYFLEREIGRQEQTQNNNNVET
jgi:uncharacterized membrane protein